MLGFFSFQLSLLQLVAFSSQARQRQRALGKKMSSCDSSVDASTWEQQQHQPAAASMDLSALRRQQAIQAAINISTTRNRTDTDVKDSNNIHFTLFKYLAEYCDIAEPTDATSDRENARVCGQLALPVLAGLRDMSMADVLHARQTSTIVHHLVQFDTLMRVEPVRNMLLSGKGNGKNPLSSSANGGGGVSKQSIVRRHGLPEKAINKARKNLAIAQSKIFGGVFYGCGAAEEPVQYRTDPSRIPTELPVYSPSELASGEHVYVNPSSIISHDDPLLALQSTPVNFEPSRATFAATTPAPAFTTSKMTRNIIAQATAAGSTTDAFQCVANLPQSVKHRKRKRVATHSLDDNEIATSRVSAKSGAASSSSSSSRRSRGGAAAENSGDDDDDDDDDDESDDDDVAANADMDNNGDAMETDTRPPPSKRAKATTAKLFLDAEAFANADTRAFIDDVILDKKDVQFKPEDNEIMTRYIKASSGIASVISKTKPTTPTTENSMAKIAEVLRPMFGTCGDQDMLRQPGVSITDAKRIALSMHTDGPMAHFTSHMQDLFKYSLENDTLFETRILDVDIVERLTALRVDVHGGIDIKKLGYRFQDIGSANASKEEAARLAEDAAQRQVRLVSLMATRNAVFQAITEQDNRLRDANRSCFSTRETASAKSLLDGKKIRPVDPVPRAHIERYMVFYSSDELQAAGFRLCKHGADCVMKNLGNLAYGRLYHSSQQQRQRFDENAGASRRSGPVSANVMRNRYGGRPMLSNNSITTTALQLYGAAAVQNMTRASLVDNVNAAISASRASDGFVGVEFLTPNEEAKFREWLAETRAIDRKREETKQKMRLTIQRGREEGRAPYCDMSKEQEDNLVDQEVAKIPDVPDPRAHLPQQCFLDYVQEITNLHYQHMMQRIPDGEQNIDRDTDEFVPLNRFQVYFRIPGEYNEDALIKTSIGAGISGSTRLGSGRSLIMGGFPEFRACSYEIRQRLSTDKAGNNVNRAFVAEIGMDFRLSLAR